MKIAAVLFMSFLADCVFGDPVYRFHPVRVMGRLISSAEKLLRNDKQSNTSAFISGMIVSLLIIILSYILPFIFLSFMYKVHYVAELAAETFFCYQIFAAKALKNESMKVYYQLEKGDMANARLYLSYIVGRDTRAFAI